MRKGTVSVIALSHKNLNSIFKAGDKVTENDVNNFGLLVKSGKIKETIEEKKVIEKEPEKKVIEKKIELKDK